MTLIEKLQNLIAKANEITGTINTNMTNAVKSLIDGYGAKEEYVGTYELSGSFGTVNLGNDEVFYAKTGRPYTSNIDYALPWKIETVFSVDATFFTTSHTSSIVGTVSKNYRCPSIQMRRTSSPAIWIGYSSTGSSWDIINEYITFDFSVMSADTKYKCVQEWVPINSTEGNYLVYIVDMTNNTEIFNKSYVIPPHFLDTTNGIKFGSNFDNGYPLRGNIYTRECKVFSNDELVFGGKGYGQGGDDLFGLMGYPKPPKSIRDEIDFSKDSQTKIGEKIVAEYKKKHRKKSDFYDGYTNARYMQEFFDVSEYEEANASSFFYANRSLSPYSTATFTEFPEIATSFRYWYWDGGVGHKELTLMVLQER